MGRVRVRIEERGWGEEEREEEEMMTVEVRR